MKRTILLPMMISSTLFATELYIEGEGSIELAAHDKIEDVSFLIESMTGQSSNEQILVVTNRRHFSTECPIAKDQSFRNYAKETSQEELDDLYYIVKTLGFKPLTKIYREKGSLKKAGDRIDHLHPLKFLLGIFSNDEMVAGVHNIRNRSWVWGEFARGIKDSLKQESDKGNLTCEQIQDFAAKLSLNPALITPSLQKHQWDVFIDVLLKNIKRNSDSGRYDI